MKITNSRFLVNSCLSENLKKCAEGLPSVCVLDVGCGKKPYRMFFPKATCYVGVDLCSASADVKGVGENLPFRPKSFDTVICTQVLEHATNPQEVLKELNGVLEDNGVLILSTHGFWVEGHEKADYWRWTLQGLCKVFEESGFRVIESHSMDSYPSLFQFISIYTPSSLIGIPFQILLNLSGLLSKMLRNRGPNMPLVHIVKAVKIYLRR